MSTMISSILALTRVNPEENLPDMAVGINGSGQIVGKVEDMSATGPQAGLWQNGTVSGLETLQGDSSGFASSINSSGLVVGYTSGNDQSGNEVDHATLWRNGSVTGLGTLGGSDSIAWGVNDQEQIVGVSTTSSGLNEAFLWENGVMLNLGTLPGGTAETSNVAIPNSVALAINDNGQVVGWSEVTGGLSHAFLWQNGVMNDLGGLFAGARSIASAINVSGEIVGSSTTAIGTPHAVSWQNGGITDLGVLPGYTSSSAEAVNDEGIVVGQSYNASNNVYHAVIWQNGSIVDLNSLLPTNSGWVLANATGINDQGQIIGDGYFNGAVNETEFVVTLGSVPIIAETVQAASQSFESGKLSTAVAIADSAANIQAGLDTLQSVASAGKIEYIAPTGSGEATINLSAAQLQNDGTALRDISGPFVLAVNASAANISVTGLPGHGNTVVFSGTANEYSISPSFGVTVTDTGTGRASTDTLYNVNAVQFSDITDIVAQVPGTTSVTSGNVAELYSAVFGRAPDVAGLAFYENVLYTSPETPLITFAQWLLASPEYANNASHHYAQTNVGETQFITDTYSNLLHRAPDTGAVPFYLNVIGQIVNSQTPGTTAYAKADSLAHATVITYFSASQEFLNDVQVTATTPSSAQHWLILT